MFKASNSNFIAEQLCEVHTTTYVYVLCLLCIVVVVCRKWNSIQLLRVCVCMSMSALLLPLLALLFRVSRYAYCLTVSVGATSVCALLLCSGMSALSFLVTAARFCCCFYFAFMTFAHRLRRLRRLDSWPRAFCLLNCHCLLLFCIANMLLVLYCVRLPHFGSICKHWRTSCPLRLVLCFMPHEWRRLFVNLSVCTPLRMSDLYCLCREYMKFRLKTCVGSKIYFKTNFRFRLCAKAKSFHF